MSSGGSDLQTVVLETTWGEVRMDATARGVVACRLPEVECSSTPLKLLCIPVVPSVLRQAVDFACAAIEGRKPGKCPPLDDRVLACATGFRRAIWAALQRIPRGATCTYAELAGQVGHPRAARAAGSACGANPFPLFVPCHRAVAAGGRLGGFSAGLAWKILLLAGEGVVR